ncbi:MAG: CdaR family protein [Bacillota bacterium]|nr:CdaR family protein [Bacillota bacterium]
MSQFIKEKILHNSKIKIFSIIFSILIWIYVMDQVNPVITKELNGMRVELLNIESLEDNELLIMNNKEFFVDVVVEGRRDEIIQLKTKDISLTADLMGYKSGMNVIKINYKSLNNEVKINRISQNDIKIELEKLVERAKPVKIEFVGQLDDKYKLKNYETNIKEIFVRGPESKVNSIKCMSGIFNLTGRKNDSESEVVIVAVDDENRIVQGVNSNKQYVDFSIRIVKEKEVNVEIEVVDKTTDAFNFKKSSYYPKKILIEGPEKTIDIIESLETKTVEITDDLGTFSLNKKIVLPLEVELVNSDGIINIYGEVEPIIIKEYEIDIDNIAMLNLDKKYIFKMITDINTINVRIKAPESVIDEIHKNEIELQIDAAEFVEGINEGILKLNLDKIEYDLSTEFIEIEITKIIEDLVE